MFWDGFQSSHWKIRCGIAGIGKKAWGSQKFECWKIENHWSIKGQWFFCEILRNLQGEYLSEKHFTTKATEVKGEVAKDFWLQVQNLKIENDIYLAKRILCDLKNGSPYLTDWSSKPACN